MSDTNTQLQTQLDLAGFEPVECAVEFPPTVDWHTTASVFGIVYRMQEVRMRKDGEHDTTRLLVLDTADGRLGVWESAGLTELFNTLKPGDTAYIQVDGERKIPGKPSPMRLFKAFRKPARR